MTPFDRSRATLPTNIRRTLEESNLPIEVATAIADLCEEHEPLPAVMLEALDITQEAVVAQVEALEDEAVALVRELNDICWGVIPSDLQARVDAVLDRADTGPDFNQERNAHADTIAAEHDSKLEDKQPPQEEKP